MLAATRAFFSERGVIEVDTPILSRAANIDAHIELIQANCAGETRYLHSSPEHCMKRLLSEGSGDIYQLSHVFRDGEIGSRHNPEFTMLEWYRLGITFAEMIQETAELCRLFLGPQELEILSYREAMLLHAGVDPFESTETAMQHRLMAEGIEVSTSDRNELLDLLMGNIVEPQLGKHGLCALIYYPGTQCAAARRTEIDGNSVAERFEMHYKGIELSNGYHELADSKELRARSEKENQQRQLMEKNTFPIDELLLATLDNLPDCCGVAVGIDRLMMLQQKTASIADVVPFAWTDV
jgi:lysyl-tRNA synthetase class 2